MAENVERLHDQEAPVRAVQRARPDLAKVGHHRAEHRAVLDPPEQVVVGRVPLDDDRRSRVPPRSTKTFTRNRV
jgi:hypothetical protein